jgi:glucuronate isomerase
MARPFIHDDFLLLTPAAKALYHGHASARPIIDFHNHLPPADLAADRQFNDLFEVWLEGDHYKWRAMRSNGVPESLVTGDATAYEKFLAFARTVPHTLRNPIYHWTHLELLRYFDIPTLLDAASAPAIWAEANRRLADPSFSARGLVERFDVRALCTTDDPADPLDHHHAIARSGWKVKVFPTFRPDKALQVDAPQAFNPWVDRLAATAQIEIGQSFDRFLEALKSRHDAFHDAGGRLSDHGLPTAPATASSPVEAARLFSRIRAGGSPASPQEHAGFVGCLMHLFATWNAGRSWTMQLHLGPLRSNNSRLLGTLGTDIGCDSIGDAPQAAALSAFLDRLDSEGALPKTILYNINPKDNYTFGTMLGNFMDGITPGKIQLGSGWWFLDQRQGMEWQLDALSNLGLLSHFVGMLTDSRSFLSFPRHEYFRRTLCNLVGRDVEDGLIPDHGALAGDLIRRVCFDNAASFLDLPGIDTSSHSSPTS